MYKTTSVRLQIAYVAIWNFSDLTVVLRVG